VVRTCPIDGGLPGPDNNAEEATPDRRLAVSVIGLAAALACLPGAVAIAAVLGGSAPLDYWIGLAGTFLVYVKVVSIAYGIGTFGFAPVAS
jgi:hypothetical protein